MSFRHDIICEKTRSPGEIRRTLANLWRNRRWALAKQEYTIANTTLIRIEMLNWVLRHDITPQKYYKKLYSREWPTL